MILHLIVTAVKGITTCVPFQRFLISKDFWLCWLFWLISGSHLLPTTPQLLLWILWVAFLREAEGGDSMRSSYLLRCSSLCFREEKGEAWALCGAEADVRCCAAAWCLLLLWAPAGRAPDWTREEGEDRAGEGGGSCVDVYYRIGL